MRRKIDFYRTIDVVRRSLDWAHADIGRVREKKKEKEEEEEEEEKKKKKENGRTFMLARAGLSSYLSKIYEEFLVLQIIRWKNPIKLKSAYLLSYLGST